MTKLSICLAALPADRAKAMDSIDIAEATGFSVPCASSLLYNLWNNGHGPISRVAKRARKDRKGRARLTYAYYTNDKAAAGTATVRGQTRRSEKVYDSTALGAAW